MTKFQAIEIGAPFPDAATVSMIRTAMIIRLRIRSTTKFETYQCALEKWFQISKDKEKLRQRLEIGFLLMSEGRMILKRVEVLRDL